MIAKNPVYKETCGKCGATRIDQQIGLEATPEQYVAELVTVFRECWRVLRDDGTLWLNLGDSYVGGGRGGNSGTSTLIGSQSAQNENKITKSYKGNCTSKPKDLIGIPWLVAFALRADGWYLRSDIIWCLSGGTWVYVRTQKGDAPMQIRDMARLNPATVKLWNGEKWTQLLGTSKTGRDSTELEIVLRSGERISCTSTHKFPTSRGLLTAGELQVGDALQRVRLPEPEREKDSLHIGEDAAWIAGLYIAEGSRSGDTIQIAGHAKEDARWERWKSIAESYGGHATRTVSGNEMSIRIYGKVINALIDELTTGKDAHTKGIAPVCWRYSNRFLAALLDGYLSGDGHWDEANGRWRLGFCRNYNLERDLRTLCARLDYKLTLNLSTATANGKSFPTFRGEIRTVPSEHWNAKDTCEIVEIRKARCREVYDLGVADEPHLFALASGILTHNSKPNPMPESVTDRPTKAHEYIFLLTKSQRYYYDAEAVREDASGKAAGNRSYKYTSDDPLFRTKQGITSVADVEWHQRNRRSVWTVATAPYSGAHFATFPPALIEPCILAGCPEGGTVLDPFNGSGTTGAVSCAHNRNYIGIDLSADYITLAHERIREAINESGRAYIAPVCKTTDFVDLPLFGG